MGRQVAAWVLGSGRDDMVRPGGCFQCGPCQAIAANGSRQTLTVFNQFAFAGLARDTAHFTHSATFMQANPFHPPRSEPPPEPGDSLSKPVFIGVSIGAGSAYIVMSLSGLVFVWYLSLSGTPMADLYRRAYDCVPYMLLAHAEGFACMAIGGYWAARTATGRAPRAALLAGVTYALFVLIQYSTPYSWPVPFWSRALSVLLPVPGYLLGARFAGGHRRAAE